LDDFRDSLRDHRHVSPRAPPAAGSIALLWSIADWRMLLALLLLSHDALYSFPPTANALINEPSEPDWLRDSTPLVSTLFAVPVLIVLSFHNASSAPAC